MYELVNTSLPNGLIAGTHGFSTVAMTRGLSDALRTRLEAYCAYSHRSSAHDATYYAENPVNWFHVVLPQGEHVIGRVSPAEFDYTGRTNRLARLLVFPKAEMPAIGGVEILKIEKARFIEPWTGDARWLELDKVTPGRLRLSPPVVNGKTPAWRMLLGDKEGFSIAKGFARLLSKNMKNGGRTIYFKTSAKHDVDGLNLLGLFTDLIELLPVDERRDVTFSTYPVICGVYMIEIGSLTQQPARSHGLTARTGLSIMRPCCPRKRCLVCQSSRTTYTLRAVSASAM